MDWFVRAFIKASVAWLSAGVTLGVAMAVHPPWVIYRPAHIHLNVLGFVAMMIFGVGYHVLPRIAGHPLGHPRLAAAHWWLANIGLALFVAGLVARAHTVAVAPAVLGAGAALSAAGAYAFAWNIWRTLAAAGRRQASTDRGTPPRRRALPIAAH
ncbi:MAG TPA: cbb3-type cytochrome c oxidase subunit I [Gemmatimonadales bacterium]|nr:cbb3-type cytochrome c oxidase subunit I [Gemmatimonadales bacterium]